MINIAISFDDGRKDNAAIIKNKLIPDRIPATLYVTTGYVDGTCPSETAPTEKPAMTVADVRALFQEPLIEIGLHGDKHLNEDWDIREGRRKLLEWLALPETHVFGFASPSTRFSAKRFLDSDDPLYRDQISYLALGICVSDLRWIRVMARKISRVIHSSILYGIAYRNTLTPNVPGRILYRVPVLGDITFRQLRAVVKRAVSRNENVVFMFHSIDDDGDRWSWSPDKFDRFCSFLLKLREKGAIRLVTTAELYQELSAGADRG